MKSCLLRGDMTSCVRLPCFMASLSRDNAGALRILLEATTEVIFIISIFVEIKIPPLMCNFLFSSLIV